jgi:hypothetical protein
MFEVVAELDDPSVARVLIAALKAHGFHPLEGGENGLAAFPGVYGPRGVAIELPAEEAGEARVLAAALVREMTGR